MSLFDPRELKSLKSDATPSRDFKAGLKKNLFAAYDLRYGVSKSISPLMKFSVAGMCALVLVFGMGTSVYAYTSPDVVEGNALYPVKAGLEQAEGALAITPQQKAQYHAKMMQRRLIEAEHASAAKPEAIQRLLGQAANELGMSLDQVKAGLKDPDTRQQIVDQLSALNARYANLLQRVPGDNGAANPPPLPPFLRLKLKQMKDSVDQSGLSDEQKATLFRQDLQLLLQAKGEHNQLINGTNP